VVIDPIIFKREITELLAAGVDPRQDLLISRRAHLITPTHRLLDAASEQAKGKAKIGSTLKGIGPTYMDKTGRNGLRVGDLTSGKFDERYQALRKKHLGLLQQFPDFEYDLESVETEWMEAAMELGQLQLIDTEHYLNEALDAGKRVLAEGAQGTMLDIDFGTYPFVTSSNTIAAGACNGLGVGPGRIGEVIGIFKAYCTRVGSGPFPTELLDATGEALREAGGEFGATTGRPRRCGWLDLVQLRYACRVNGVTQLAMMKADVLSGFDEIPVCHSYQYEGATTLNLPYGIEPDEVTPDYKNHGGWQEDLTGATTEAALPESLTNYIAMVEKEMATPISIVSVGPDRAQTIER